ncbi:MAG: hypothetical protein HY321_13740 [Armatimonadetes bacterium]|nr:hypothetical protein [Armatimonadota bacterium]
MRDVLIRSLAACALLAAPGPPGLAAPAAPPPPTALVVAHGTEPLPPDLAPANAEALLPGAGYEVARFRGVVVAEPAGKGSVRERLAAALPPEERELVFHQPLAMCETPPDFSVLLNAIRVLYTGRTDDRAARAVGDAVRWMMGNGLDVALWRLVEAQALRGEPVEGAWSLAGRWRKGPRAVLPWDPCPAHLRFSLAKPVEDEFAAGITLTVHHPAHDVLNAKGAGGQGGDSYEAGYWVPGPAEPVPLPLLQSAAWSAPVEVTARDASLAAAADALRDASGQAVTGALPDGGARATVIARGAPLRDLLICLARVGGAALAADGTGIRLAAPQTTAERLWTALPLRLWSAARLSRAERLARRRALERALWDDLPPTGFGSVSTLRAAPRARLADLLETAFAGGFGMILADLPDAQGNAYLALLEDEKTWSFYLRTRGSTERISAMTYVRLKAEMIGHPVTIPPVPGPKEGGS